MLVNSKPVFPLACVIVVIFWIRMPISSVLVGRVSLRSGEFVQALPKRSRRPCPIRVRGAMLIRKCDLGVSPAAHMKFASGSGIFMVCSIVALVFLTALWISICYILLVVLCCIDFRPAAKVNFASGSGISCLPHSFLCFAVLLC